MRTIVVLALALAYALVPAAALASSANPDAGFKVKCDYSHTLSDDPIVFPNQPGMSHAHDFLGAADTNADSSFRSMRAAGSNCGLKADTAGYWLPTLYGPSGAIHPAEGTAAPGGEAASEVIYYRNDLDPSVPIHTIPKGLRIVVGNSHATSPSDNAVLGTSKLYYNCNDGWGPQAQVATPPSCGDGILVVHVRFPQCWDGVHLDSADHFSHMAWSEGGVCPVDHPVAIPRVIIRAEYPVGDPLPPIMWASGAFYTIHGDFWNTWNQRKLGRLVTRCFGQDVDCGTFSAAASDQVRNG
jgi:Domain of unknown function (DUF1996)